MVPPNYSRKASNKQAVKDAAAALELVGVLDKITFQSSETGFTVARLQTAEHSTEGVTVVGALAGVAVGSTVAVRGQWRQDPRHGRQFMVDTYRVVRPDTLIGIEKYLGSGMIKGIGPSYAARIVAHFGLDTLKILEGEPERLREVPGLGRKRVERLAQAWREQRDLHEIMVLLQGHDISAAKALKIYRTYGQETLRIIRENPYRLAEDIWGISFKIADRIAVSLGMPTMDPRRARAGLLFVLREAAGQGHCYLERNELIRQSTGLLEMPSTLLESELMQLLADEKAVLSWDKIYLAPLYYAETGAAAGFLRLLAGAPSWGEVRVEQELPAMQGQLGLQLAAEQQEALQTVLSRRLAVITGGPGTGKSTILKALILLLEKSGVNISLAAPTGRAAKRLGEAAGREARTIHRLLEFDPVAHGFRRNERNFLEADLVVIDEVSMLDIFLANSLVRALPPGGALLLVGDADQLPPVGPGNVLKDLIEAEIAPVARLSRIFRQGAGSLISLNAAKVNRGEPFELLPDYQGDKDFYYIHRETDREIEAEILSLCGGRLTRKYGFDLRRDIQVLTPMRKGLAGMENLNLRLQELLRESMPARTQSMNGIFPGDKVMQLRNNYDKEIFNGDIGYVNRVEVEDDLLLVDFEGRLVTYEPAECRELQLAYAITVHKSQGSEFPCVIMPLHTSHAAMLQRNLLYTGLTRGRRLVIVVGSRRAVGLALANNRVQTRHSALRQRLLDRCGLDAPIPGIPDSAGDWPF
jgi:exodeoxyribonuclease V alpha subunit